LPLDVRDYNRRVYRQIGPGRAQIKIRVFDRMLSAIGFDSLAETGPAFYRLIGREAQPGAGVVEAP
jgi:hypothetical protein